MKINSVAKAVIGGVAAGAAAAGTAAQDGRITVPEMVTIVAAILGAYGITWAVPNRQPAEKP